MSHMPRTRTALLGSALVLLPLAAGAAGCGGPASSGQLSAEPYDAADQVAANAPAGDRKADPNKPLEIRATGDEARMTDVTATDAAGRFVRGELDDDGKRWHSTAPLAAATRYTVRVSTEDEDGKPGRKVLQVVTKGNGDRRLRVTFGPDSGTYGVGQPLTAELSRPIRGERARAVVEGALRVDSSPRVVGSWHWVDDRTLHYRPRDYWPAHASISARSNLQGLKISEGLYGGAAKPVRLRTGDKVVALTDAGAHRMTFRRNGKVVKTLPVTTGKPGFDTRNGIKVVLGKESFVRMNSSTVGIARGSSEAYNLPVHWATRVTWSGEYVHAAPWSVGSQGAANVSHGCTGMSTANARWFFENVRNGDVVQVVGSEGDTMTPFDNGFGDWNMSWSKWRAGSALGGGTSGPGSAQKASGSADAARLRPGV